MALENLSRKTVPTIGKHCSLSLSDHGRARFCVRKMDEFILLQNRLFLMAKIGL